jgi:cobalt-zinc-cadmium efflux system membrane fusion protein
MTKRLCALLMTAAISGCSGRPAEAPREAEQREQPNPKSLHGHDDEPGHAMLPTRVRLAAQVIRDAQIKTAEVKREALAATIDLPGEVSFDPDKTASVSALVSGRIEAVSFSEGQHVKKGDVLATIRVLDLGKVRAAFTATSAKAAAARSNADRLEALADKRLAAAQEVLAARADADALEADARAAEQELRALGTDSLGTNAASELRVRAPISADVVFRNAVVGQTVTAEHVLATLTDLRELWFLGRVFEKSLASIQRGAPVEIHLNAYPQEAFSGSVDYLSTQVDPAARTVTARIRIHNRGDLLRVGLFGVARVATGVAADALLPTIVVPRNAVTEIGDKPVVFVRQPDGDFDMHEIVLGQGALGKIQVLNGLREGEQVVVDGVFTLKSAVLKSTFGEAE